MRMRRGKVLKCVFNAVKITCPKLNYNMMSKNNTCDIALISCVYEVMFQVKRSCLHFRRTCS